MRDRRSTALLTATILLIGWSGSAARDVWSQDTSLALAPEGPVTPTLNVASNRSLSRVRNASTRHDIAQETRERAAGVANGDRTTSERADLNPEFGATESFESSEIESGEEGEIETDRDSFTPSTKTVAFGRWLFESSYSFIDQRQGYETHSFPEILLRYGLTERMEMRLGWNYELGGPNSLLTGNTQHHHTEFEEGSRLLYGIKWAAFEQQGPRPETSFIVQGSTPTFGESSDTFLSVTGVSGWQTHNGLTIDFATRFQTSQEDEDHFNVWSPSAVVKMPFGNGWKGHVEYFGVFTDKREVATQQHFFSPGVHRLLHENLEVGIRVGWGLNDDSPGFFSNIGFGWQY